MKQQINVLIFFKIEFDLLILYVVLKVILARQTQVDANLVNQISHHVKLCDNTLQFIFNVTNGREKN